MALMEFLVRVQNVLQLFAFVSNSLRLPRPQVPLDSRVGALCL